MWLTGGRRRRRGGVRRRYVVCTELFYGTCSMVLAAVLSSCNGKSSRYMDSVLLKILKVFKIFYTSHGASDEVPQNGYPSSFFIVFPPSTFTDRCCCCVQVLRHPLHSLLLHPAPRIHIVCSSYLLPAFFIPGCCLLNAHT